MTVEKWLTLIVESVYPVDAGTLVVATQHEEVLGVLQLSVSDKYKHKQILLPLLKSSMLGLDS